MRNGEVDSDENVRLQRLRKSLGLRGRESRRIALAAMGRAHPAKDPHAVFSVERVLSKALDYLFQRGPMLLESEYRSLSCLAECFDLSPEGFEEILQQERRRALGIDLAETLEVSKVEDRVLDLLLEEGPSPSKEPQPQEAPESDASSLPLFEDAFEPQDEPDLERSGVDFRQMSQDSKGLGPSSQPNQGSPPLPEGRPAPAPMNAISAFVLFGGAASLALGIWLAVQVPLSALRSGLRSLDPPSVARQETSTAPPLPRPARARTASELEGLLERAQAAKNEGDWRQAKGILEVSIWSARSFQDPGRRRRGLARALFELAKLERDEGLASSSGQDRAGIRARVLRQDRIRKRFEAALETLQGEARDPQGLELRDRILASFGKFLSEKGLSGRLSRLQAEFGVDLEADSEEP